MRSNYYDLYLLLGVLLLVSFMWYYLTLPGSTLSVNKKEAKRPTLEVALKSYVIYIIPLLVLNYYSIRDKFNL